ncbi:MAG: hypothetical protein WAJ87_12240 [Bryobacteraceae bacterium]
MAPFSGTLSTKFIPYPQRLLEVAQSLIDQSEFSIAVVVAHMACEVATERSLSESIARKGLQYLEEPLLDFLSGYNLASDRIRKLYSALTGDTVQNASFWQKFKASATRRNEIVHAGAIVGKAEAEESHKAASDLVAHLKS